MTNAYETSAAASSVRRRNGMRILSDAVQLFWTVTDGYARRRLLLALALVAAGALLAALTPIALKLIVDSLSDKAASGLDSLLPLTLVMLYVIGQYLWRCSSELRMMLHGHAEQRVRRHIGARLFEHLVRLPLQFHLERKTGAMGETAEQGIRGYQLLLHHLVYTILPVMIELGMVAVVMLYFGHQIYLLILGASAIAYAAAFYHGSLAVHQSAERVASSHIEAHALLTDSLINHETVKYFDAEPVVCHRYDAALSRSESAWRRFFSSRAVNGLLVATIFAMSLGFSLVYAASDVARGIITVGDFVLVNAYIVRVVQPLEMLGSAVRDIAQGVAFLGSMLALFREKTEGGEGAVTSLAQKTRGELAFVGVSFSYRQERVVLSNVSLVVPAGKTVAVVGVSGSGKSSLIRLLFRLYEPDSGRILLDGTPISELSLSAVRRAIAVVPQDTVLFHDTIGRNIAFGRFGATQYEIEEAARVANLHDFILALPEGYETLVGERGLKLSGGERQRVAIARAALKRPRIFVFDEATSSLDSKTEREILRNLVDLSSRSTTLVIAHRLSTVVHADEILVLDHGIIVERGTHDGLRAVKGHYAALWNAQQSGAHGRGEAHASIT